MMISRRNFLAVAGAAAAAAALTACGGSSLPPPAPLPPPLPLCRGFRRRGRRSKIAKVALTCDTGTIDDESFNQACWSCCFQLHGR